MKKVFDEIEVSDLIIDADPSFGKMCLHNQDGTGLVVAEFKIGGANFEYQERYSVSEGEVEKVDTMHPGATSDLAVMLDDYIKTVQHEYGIGWNFFSEMNDYIESNFLNAGSDDEPRFGRVAVTELTVRFDALDAQYYDVGCSSGNAFLATAEFRINSIFAEYSRWVVIVNGKVEFLTGRLPDAKHHDREWHGKEWLDDYVRNEIGEQADSFFVALRKVIKDEFIKSTDSKSLLKKEQEQEQEQEQKQKQKQEQHELISPAELIALAKSIDVVGEYQNIAQVQEALDSGIEALSKKLALVIDGAKVRRVDCLYRIVVSLPLRDGNELFAVAHAKEGFILHPIELGHELDEIADEIYSNIISSYFEYLSR